ncbi:phosphoethanolamine transferase [Acinetobacter baumannii]|uniref:phosphoethanolamine transferase n=1 Tax=Acinetobacter baumannii TaxID=470 RepID=UPI003891B8F9
MGVGLGTSDSKTILLMILIIICGSSKKAFYYFTIPLVALYSIYTPIGLTYGGVAYHYIASAFATDTNETYEFFVNIPIKNYLIGLIIIPLVLIYYQITTKLDIKIYKNKTILILFIIIALFKQAPFQFFTDIKNSIKEVKKEQKILEDLDKKTSWEKNQLTNSKYDTYVLIIGESVRRDYLHAYGYSIPNTPFLSNSKGILIDGLTAPAKNTVASLRLMLTQATTDSQPQYDKNFVDLANQSGFKTYWLSNQGYLGEHDTPITAIAKKSSQTFFLKKGAYDSLNTSDFSLIPEFKKLITNKNKKLIVIHLYGSHPNACDRIEDYPKILDKIDSKYDEINCYISSIKKTDAILQEIYTSLVNVEKKDHLSFSMLYFADHGLSSQQDGDSVVLRVGEKKQSYQIPLFMVNSDSIDRKKCESFKSGLNFTNGIGNWLGIYNQQLPKYSLFDCKNDSNQINHQTMLNNSENDTIVNF